MLFKTQYNKLLINLDRLVITEKYQISIFYVRTSPYVFVPYCQDHGLIFWRNDRTLG